LLADGRRNEFQARSPPSLSHTYIYPPTHTHARKSPQKKDFNREQLYQLDTSWIDTNQPIPTEKAFPSMCGNSPSIHPSSCDSRKSGKMREWHTSQRLFQQSRVTTSQNGCGLLLLMTTIADTSIGLLVACFRIEGDNNKGFLHR
jgi:hypothetical protein